MAEKFDPYSFKPPKTYRPYELQALVLLAAGVPKSVVAETCGITTAETALIRKRRLALYRRLKLLTPAQRNEVMCCWVRLVALAQITDRTLSEPPLPDKDLSLRLRLLERLSDAGSKYGDVDGESPEPEEPEEEEGDPPVPPAHVRNVEDEPEKNSKLEAAALASLNKARGGPGE